MFVKDEMGLAPAFSNPQEAKLRPEGDLEKYAYYGSFGRSQLNSWTRGAASKFDPIVTIVVNGQKLGQNYKGAPVEFFAISSRKHGSSEMEDRVFSDEPRIENFITNYVEEVHIYVPKMQELFDATYDRIKDGARLFHNVTPAMVLSMITSLESRGIKVYMYGELKEWLVLKTQERGGKQVVAGSEFVKKVKTGALEVAKDEGATGITSNDPLKSYQTTWEKVELAAFNRLLVSKNFDELGLTQMDKFADRQYNILLKYLRAIYSNGSEDKATIRGLIKGILTSINGKNLKDESMPKMWQETIRNLEKFMGKNVWLTTKIGYKESQKHYEIQRWEANMVDWVEGKLIERYHDDLHKLPQELKQEFNFIVRDW